MIENIEARHIQEALRISKIRYEYLKSKMQISPEINEVEGTGRAHRYSFRNVMQFALADRANALGLSPKTTKDMLYFIERNPEVSDLGLFDPDKKNNLSIHYGIYEGKRFFKVTPTKQEGFYTGEGFEAFLIALKEKNDWGTIKQAFNLMKNKKFELSECEGFVTLNIGVIKDQIIKKLI